MSTRTSSTEESESGRKSSRAEKKDGNGTSGTAIRRGPQHDRLEKFIGTWNMEGQGYESPLIGAAKWTAVNTFEWLTGRYFVVHRLQGQMDGQAVACIEIMGYDAENERYSAHTYYNDGRTHVWDVKEEGGTWTLSGEQKLPDRAYEVRCTIDFADAGATMTARWEYLGDGAAWLPFLDTKMTKV